MSLDVKMWGKYGMNHRNKRLRTLPCKGRDRPLWAPVSPVHTDVPPLGPEKQTAEGGKVLTNGDNTNF